jgi:hypothetical protein
MVSQHGTKWQESHPTYTRAQLHAVCDASDDRSVLLPTALQCMYISNMQGFRENPIILSDLLRSNEVFPNNWSEHYYWHNYVM